MEIEEDNNDQVIFEINLHSHRFKLESSHRFKKFRKSKWLAIVVAFLAVLIDGINYGLFVPLVPLYQELLQLSDIEVGVIFGIFAIFVLLSSPFVGYLVDSFGRRVNQYQNYFQFFF